MNIRCGKLCEELSNITMCVYRGSPRQFVAAVEPVRVGHADLDPGVNASSEISTENRRFVPSRDTFGQRNSLSILEAVCEHAQQHVFDGLGWLSRDAELQTFVNVAIDVGQIDVEVVNRCCQRHRDVTVVLVNTPVYYLKREGRKDEA